MKTSIKQQLWFKKYVTFALAAAAIFMGTTKIHAQEKFVKNIVIVHGHYLRCLGLERSLFHTY